MSKRKGDSGYADGWCIHYRGTVHGVESCEAGIHYKTAFRDRGVNFQNQPCFLVKGESKPDAAHCEHLRRPTKEEIALHEQWFEKHMNMQRTVMTGIHPWREKHKGKSHAEVVECPSCKGRLHLSIAAYNGHVHGKCETEDCVSWME